MEGLGVRCVSDQPWVTAAETAECALALDAMGRRDRAIDLLSWAQVHRCPDGTYWTGIIYPEKVTFPVAERTTYTAGAIIQEFDGKFTVPAANGPNGIAAESFALAVQVYQQGKPPIPVIDHFVDVIPSKCATQAPPEINAIVLDARASYDNPAALKVVRTQLYKGGVRLAEILNSMFDHP